MCQPVKKKVKKKLKNTEKQLENARKKLKNVGKIIKKSKTSKKCRRKK